MAAAFVILLLACTASAESPTGGESARRVDIALQKAARYLVSKQSPDGAWRSETYGAMRDGPSLTPLVMSALLFLPQAGADGQAAIRKGAGYLAGFAGEDGRLKVQARELLFPVYTAASASRVLVLVERSPRNVRAQQAWLAYLRGRQLNESLGWQPADPEYGGWGYALDVPRKPAPGKPKELLHESNLAATVFALAALRSAKVPAGDPAYAQALGFVKRCQNFSDDPAAADPKFDDGGFYFIPGDAAQNKAGAAGTDRFGHARFHSYGTMTADGLRAAPLWASGGPSAGGRGAELAHAELLGGPQPRRVCGRSGRAPGRDVVLLDVGRLARLSRPSPGAVPHPRWAGRLAQGVRPRVARAATPRWLFCQPVHGREGGRPAGGHVVGGCGAGDRPCDDHRAVRHAGRPMSGGAMIVIALSVFFFAISAAIRATNNRGQLIRVSDQDEAMGWGATAGKRTIAIYLAKEGGGD